MTLAEALFDNLYWLFLAVLLVNILQRKHSSRAKKKRFAILYLAIAIFLIQFWAGFIMMQELSDFWLLPGIALIVAAVVYFKKYTLPFRFRCQVSGKRLDIETFLYRDSNILNEYEKDNKN